MNSGGWTISEVSSHCDDCCCEWEISTTVLPIVLLLCTRISLALLNSGLLMLYRNGQLIDCSIANNGACTRLPDQQARLRYINYLLSLAILLSSTSASPTLIFLVLQFSFLQHLHLAPLKDHIHELNALLYFILFTTYIMHGQRIPKATSAKLTVSSPVRLELSSFLTLHWANPYSYPTPALTHNCPHLPCPYPTLPLPYPALTLPLPCRSITLIMSRRSVRTCSTLKHQTLSTSLLLPRSV